MSAQPQRQQSDTTQSERKPRAYRQSTDNRVVALETQWDVVIPTLATKADLSDLKADLTDKVARVESAVRTEINEAAKGAASAIAHNQSSVHELMLEIAQMRKDIDAQTNKIIIRLGGVMLAIVTLACTVIGLIVTSRTGPAPHYPVSIQQPAPITASQSPTAPAPAPVQPVQPATPPQEEAVRRLESGNP